jgi:hypothetical protein
MTYSSSAKPFDIATVSSSRPNPLELDSLECSSTFREWIPTFEEGGQNLPAAIAILHMFDMIH